jgi:hypothetical protein
MQAQLCALRDPKKNRNRSLAKDVEATIESAVTWLYIARIKLMSRRLAAA